MAFFALAFLFFCKVFRSDLTNFEFPPLFSPGCVCVVCFTCYPFGSLQSQDERRKFLNSSKLFSSHLISSHLIFSHLYRYELISSHIFSSHFFHTVTLHRNGIAFYCPNFLIKFTKMKILGSNKSLTKVLLFFFNEMELHLLSHFWFTEMKRIVFYCPILFLYYMIDRS
jgi:hypothetical protein